MPLQILGQVTDIQTTNPVENAQIVIVEPGSTEVLASTTTTVGSAGPGGYFTFDFTFEQMNAVLGGHHHKTITFKVYDEDTVFLGSQDALISSLTFTGTETFVVEVDASYTPPSEGLLFAVAGKVVEADGSPIAGLDVNVYHKKLASEDLLETEQTAADGRFLVRYEGPAGSHPDHALITIQVRAYDGMTLVASSDHICNPRHDLTLLLVRDDEELRGPPALVAFMAGLDPHLDEVEYYELTADQVHYLACKTGYPELTIATIARAHQLEEALGIDAEAFYGIAHAGFPLSTNAVLGLDEDTVEAALLKAIADNAIPATVEADIPTITAALAAARLDRAVPATSPETTTLGAVLTAASLAAGVPRAFAEAYMSHTGTIEEFWAGLRADTEDFGDAVVDTIQFTLEAGALTGSHVPLVKLLNQMRANEDFSLAAELAQYDDADWIGFLAEEVESNPVSTPPGIPGVDETERRSNYGRAISRMVEDLYPSAHIAYHLPEGVATSDVPGFVIQNPGFSFLRTVIDDFLETAAGVPGDPGEKETLRQDLLKIQRVMNVVPRYQRTAAAGALLDGGIVSARQIRSMGAASFKAEYGAALGGATAASIYDKADEITATVLTAVTRMRPELIQPAMNVFTTPGCGDPDLEHIFGSLDYCACRHCDSVYSPAAYFVDIMNFLRAPKQGENDALEAILARRPELMHVKLNCENAETPLPTLDMVNEVLERAVLAVHEVDPHTNPATWPQTTWDASDLLAHPEKIYTAVYDTYLSDEEVAVYPSLLPFDLSLEEARIYLTHLGISRIDLQDAFEGLDSDLDESEGFRIDERLGLSPGQGVVVRDAADSETLYKYWGFETGTGWLTQINKVETFLERSELTFDELKVLLRLDLLDDTEILFDEPCKLKDAEFRLIASPETAGLDEAKLGKLVAMLRLSRSLGWSVFELDMVLRGLQLSLTAPINTDLNDLARFVRVRRWYPRLALGEVLSWWAPLDTRAPDERTYSYYEEVVRPNTREHEFQIDEIDENAKTLDEVKGSLLGILQIDEASLSAAFTAVGVTGASTLTLAHLSRLYRIASLSRATALEVADLAILINYTAALKEGTPGPFDGAPASPVRDLLEIAADVRASRFSVSTLDFILRDAQPERFGASDSDVTRALIELIVALQASDADFAASLPPEDLPSRDRVGQLLARLHEGEALEDRLGLVDMTTPAEATQLQAEEARNALFPFLADAGDAFVELGKAFGDGADPEVRADKLLPELVDHMRALARGRTAVQKLATLLDIEPADVDAFLDVVEPGLSAFTADAFVNAFDPLTHAEDAKEETFPRIFLDIAGVGDPADQYRTLRKVALVVRGFRFSPGLLRWILVHGPTASVDILNLAALPGSGATNSEIYTAYSGWDWLRRLVEIRDHVLGAVDDLLPLLDLVFADEFNKANTLAALARSAGWDSTTLTTFEAELTLLQAGFQELGAIEGLAKAFSASRRMGVDPLTLHDWATATSVLAAQAADIKGAAQAKHSPKAWPSIAEPLRGRLRERQRDALAAYLVGRIDGVDDREDLLTHFLMDPEVSSCGRTSRLLFATSAVQLFVQRALMGFEDGVVLDGGEWAWMKRYRVWEANRKIFLYPENWVLPELRDDKTHLFRQLEEELSQGEITEEGVEDAYIHYLEGLNEISRLEICGTYHELEVDENHQVVVDRYHVFGRTYDNPSKVFYRQMVDNAYWTPWEALPFSIEAQDLLPAVINRRLVVMWPKYGLRSFGANSQTEDSGPPTKIVETGLMWAERKGKGWSSIRTSSTRSVDTAHPIMGVDDSEDQDFYQNRFLLLTAYYTSITVRPVYFSGTQKDAYFQYGEFFNYNPVLDRFVARPGSALATQLPAIDEDGLTGPIPTPKHLTIKHQAFATSETGKGLILPIRDHITKNLEWSPTIINTPTGFEVMFPRQTTEINSLQPFTFEDERVVLYFRRTNRPETPYDDGPKDKAVPASTGTKSLTPYLGLLGVHSEAQPQSATSTQLILSGGGNAANTQTWLPTKVGKIPTFRVSPLYHPHTHFFIEQVRRHGARGLLAPQPSGPGKLQDLVFQELEDDIAAAYVPDPNECIDEPFASADIDFDFGGAYSVYNWELFYHIPMYVADRLMAERRFAEAQKWLHYIFDPTQLPTTIEGTDCKYYWRIRPFREAAAHVTIDDLLELLHYDGSDPTKIKRRDELRAQVSAWRDDPFRPHLVARMRPTAYMRAVVMKYLDNLIAWGDDLFRQDTLESNNEAVLYYALALQILGKRPRKLDADERPDYTLQEALDDTDGLDEFSNFLVELENKVLGGLSKVAIPLDEKAQADQQQADPDEYKYGYVLPPSPALEGAPQIPSAPPVPVNLLPFKAEQPDASDPVRTALYFCIPPNDKLLSYWDIVADRLFKLRNCLNLDGVRRSLPLFEPPIDPALLAKGAAQGIDLATAIGNLNAPIPHYRFMVHLGVAKDFAGQVAGLGASLLAALEKRDAEALAVLRAGQEVKLLASVRRVRDAAIREAEENIAALQAGRRVVEERLKYYKSRERMNVLEKVELGLQARAVIVDLVGTAHTAIAGVAAAFPNLFVGLMAALPESGATTGGQSVSKALELIGRAASADAGMTRAGAAMVAAQASYTRRKEEWDFQVTLAERDIAQIDKQITAAEIRKAMAELELKNHDQQAGDSAAVLEYMQSKFTNTELYAWMSGEISKLYFQAFNLAVDLARRAERCYRYELAIPDSDVTSFVSFGHWDNRRKGLLAGERLAQDIRRMEAAYYEKNRREYELTKRVSLASLDPVALIALRKTGACHFFLPETIFNLDHPSHYLRRLKMVSVSIPAVTGPYTSLGATLTYESGVIRREPAPGDISDQSETSVQTIAVSVGQDDAGLFEPNLRDERYLPFEGKGVVDSSWRLELPATVRTFDYETISDVILTIRYTSREGGSGFGAVVQSGLSDALKALPRADLGSEAEKGAGQVRLFSARAEFPEAWRAFIAAGIGGGAAELELELSEDRFPHREEPKERSIQMIAVFVRFKPDAIANSMSDLTAPTLNGPGVTDESLTWTNYKAGSPASYPEYVWFDMADELASEPGTFTLSVDTGWPSGKEPEDILLLVRYQLD